MSRRLPLLALFISACAATNGLDGRSAVVNVSEEPPSSACEFGGVKIQSGQDANGDGALDPGEVEDTQYVCNGGETEATLTRAAAEDPGANCEFGGVRIDLGADLDENGALGDAEVDDTEYVCNGDDGEDGTNGTNGTNGTDGADGADGDDGLSYLTEVVALPANGPCGAEAGARIDAGPDANGNGTLDAAEVASSETICDGADGAGGSGGSAVIASNYSEPEARSDGAAITVVSVTITATGPGTVVAFGSTHAYCSSSIAPLCYTGGLTPAYVRVVNTAAGDPSVGTGWGYVHLADNTTENVARSNTFTVPSAGSYTYYLRGQAQVGSVGFWRSQLNAVYVPD